MLNRDFQDMLSALSAQGVEFLVVGAYAVAAHGCPRATGDMDIWVRATPENAQRTFRALQVFGAPMDQITVRDLHTPDTVFQMGVEPRRIDILTSIDAVEFDDAWGRRKPVELGEGIVFVLGRGDLMRNKRAAGRPKDLADLALLEARGASE